MRYPILFFTVSRNEPNFVFKLDFALKVLLDHVPFSRFVWGHKIVPEEVWFFLLPSITIHFYSQYVSTSWYGPCFFFFLFLLLPFQLVFLVFKTFYVHNFFFGSDNIEGGR